MYYQTKNITKYQKISTQFQRLKVYNGKHDKWEEILNIKRLRDKLYWYKV